MRLEPRYAPCPRCRSTKRCAHERPAFERCSELVDGEGVMIIDLTGNATEEETREPVRSRR